MFDELNVGATEDAELHFDRDPIAFAAVVSVLRGEEVLVPHGTSAAAVMREFKFFFDKSPRVWTAGAYEFAHHRSVYEHIVSTRAAIVVALAHEMLKPENAEKKLDDVDELFPVAVHHEMWTSRVWSDGNAHVVSAEITIEDIGYQDANDMQTVWADSCFSFTANAWPNKIDVMDGMLALLDCTTGATLPYNGKEMREMWFEAESDSALVCEINAAIDAQRHAKTN